MPSTIPTHRRHCWPNGPPRGRPEGPKALPPPSAAHGVDRRLPDGGPGGDRRRHRRPQVRRGGLCPIFGGSAAQTEIIDKIGYPVGASDTDNGVTITADAVMGDAYNAAIIFTITRDDGTALLPAGTEDAMLLVRGGGADLNIPGGTHGGSWFVDEDPADNTVQLIQTISADVPLNDCTATAKFDDLWMWDEESGEAVPFAEGTWKLRFDVQYEDASVTLGGGETFTQAGMTFTIDAVTVSPVAFKVDYTVDSEVQWSDSGSGQQSEADSREMQRYFENVEILLTKVDGTVIDLSNAGGSISPRTASPSAPRARCSLKSSLWRRLRASPWAAWCSLWRDQKRNEKAEPPKLRFLISKVLP